MQFFTTLLSSANAILITSVLVFHLQLMKKKVQCKNSRGILSFQSILTNISRMDTGHKHHVNFPVSLYVQHQA